MEVDFIPFRPHPLVRGGHLQTIVGNYLPSRFSCESKVVHVPLADGDAIAVHDDGGGQEHATSEVVLLVHGLGGCYESGYMLRCSAKLRAAGFRVFRMDLRGCGAGMGLAKRPLHAGRSDDAGAVLAHVNARCPQTPLHVVGFSMGANIVLKLAGELGAAAPPYWASLMAVSPPIDLARCSAALGQGFNRVYDQRFVQSLLKHVQERDALVKDALTCSLVPRPRRLIDFDNVFTAPLSGFRDVHDYYAQSSSAPLLKRICVPTLVLTAASDPIVPVEAFERAEYSAATQLLITPCGGHLGYVAARGSDPDRRWLDWRVVDWVKLRSGRVASPVAHEADHGPVEHAVRAVIQLDGAAT